MKQIKPTFLKVGSLTLILFTIAFKENKIQQKFGNKKEMIEESRVQRSLSKIYIYIIGGMTAVLVVQVKSLILEFNCLSRDDLRQN